MLFLSFPLHIWADKRLPCSAHPVREPVTRTPFLPHLQVFPDRLDPPARLPSWQDLCVVCLSASSKLGTSFKGTMGKGAASSSKNARCSQSASCSPVTSCPRVKACILETRSRVSLEQAGWPHPRGCTTGPWAAVLAGHGRGHRMNWKFPFLFQRHSCRQRWPWDLRSVQVAPRAEVCSTPGPRQPRGSPVLPLSLL